MKIFRIITFLSLIFIGFPLQAVNLQFACEQAWNLPENKTYFLKTAGLLTEVVNQARSKTGVSLLVSGFLGTYEPFGNRSSSGMGASATLLYPLFPNGTYYTQEQRAKQLLNAQLFTQSFAELMLIDQVTQVYMSILTLEKNNSLYEDMIVESQKRLSLLKKWAMMGRIKQSDVLGADIQLQQLKASLESNFSSLQQARLQFSFLTGLSQMSELEDPRFVLKGLEFDESVLANRLDIKSQESVVVAASEWLAYQQNETLPKIDAIASSQYVKNLSINQNTSFLGVQLSYPSFVVGTERFELKQAQWQLDIEKIVLERLKRQALSVIKQTASDLKGKQLVLDTQTKTLETTKKYVKLVEDDYEKRLATQVDVNMAVSSLIEVQKNVYATYFQMQTLLVRLHLLKGNKPW